MAPDRQSRSPPVALTGGTAVGIRLGGENPRLFGAAYLGDGMKDTGSIMRYFLPGCFFMGPQNCPVLA